MTTVVERPPRTVRLLSRTGAGVASSPRLAQIRGAADTSCKESLIRSLQNTAAFDLFRSRRSKGEAARTVVMDRSKRSRPTTLVLQAVLVVATLGVQASAAHAD